jgi:hypothetical protein
MPDLSFSEVKRISSDIGREEITFSHLLDDLIDHVCCAVEDEMQHGLGFEDAYRKVKKQIGPRRLKEIQEETLYAVDTKYRYMKNLMKISGVAGTVLFGIGAAFKIQHWPGAGILLTFGALFLILLFLPSALQVLWKESHSTKKLFLFISAFLTGILFIGGTLFKVQHWPMAGMMLTVGAGIGIFLFIPALLINRMNDPEKKAKHPAYIMGAAGAMLYIAGLLFKIQHWPMSLVLMVAGLILLIILAVPYYTWVTWKDEKNISAVFIFLILGTMLVIMPGALMNLSLQHSYNEYYYTNGTQQNEMYSYLYRNNRVLLNRYHDSSTYKAMEKVHSKTVELLASISSFQEKMVQQSEGKPGIPALANDQIKHSDSGTEIQFRQLSYILDPAPAADFLSPGCAERKRLNAFMADYLSFLAAVLPADNLPECKKILDPESVLPASGDEIKSRSLISGLHSLQLLKNRVLTVEAAVIKGFSNSK